MDREQQVRLNFLEEADQYYDRMETVLIGLADRGAEPQQLDEVLRLTHSIKGGAGMMGFMPLSQVAHRLEDFLKILRARYQSEPLDNDLESWLLQGVDYLRHVSALHRQGREIGDDWFEQHTQPLFAKLYARLGDLQEADENALLSAEEDVDVSLILFESGVEEALERFEAVLATSPDASQVVQALQATAHELITFGRMRDMDAFIQLCESVAHQAKLVSQAETPILAQQALKVWRQSEALVSLGRTEQIPSQLGFVAAASSDAALISELSLDSISTGTTEPLDLFNTDSNFDFSDLADLDAAIADLDVDQLAAELGDSWAAEYIDFGADLSAEAEIPVAELSESELSVSELSESSEFIAPEPTEQPEPGAIDLEMADLALTGLDLDDLDLTDLDLTGLELPELSLETTLDIAELMAVQEIFTELVADAVESAEPVAAIESVIEPAAEATESEVEPVTLSPEQSLISRIAAMVPKPVIMPAVTSATETSGKTVRVPLEQLQRFNTLFSGLVLERNAVNLRLGQMKGFITLLRERLYRLEQSNTQLRKWYDKASLEGVAAVTHSSAPAGNPARPTEPARLQRLSNFVSVSNSSQFDALEMDRYTDLHLLSQEQMETIVQLQEVMGDVEFSLREMGLAVQGLNQTTRAVQESATRMQMRPFNDAVGRFPRAVRDWSMTYGKSVTLKLVGESTLLDRDVLDALGDPLMHLLRNAFDHGIESTESRLAAGKPAQGTITLQAAHQGNRTLITISDDGQGISLDKIRERARKQGFPESLLKNANDQDLLELIFEPGFTTAEQVSELSGRGVGMDVVRTNLEQLRGDIQVATELGKGTTFTIRLPFNLSILPVVLLEHAGMVFSAPADSIRQVLRPVDGQVVIVGDKEHLNWQGQTIPLLHLEQWLGHRRPGKPFLLEGTPAINQTSILLVGQGATLCGIYLDKVWGEQEVAIRSISSPIPLPPGFYSSSLLGDGRVVPLVDLVQLTSAILGNTITAQTSAESSAAMEQARARIPILVVDDSVNVRNYLAMVLERAGYQVEQARDGQDAVEQLAGGLKVQAVLCDMEMPRLDGYGVLTELRGQAAFAELPIAMLTSRSGDKHRKLAMNLGATAYLSKPCTDQELLNSLKMMLEQTQMILA